MIYDTTNFTTLFDPCNLFPVITENSLLWHNSNVWCSRNHDYDLKPLSQKFIVIVATTVDVKKNPHYHRFWCWCFFYKNCYISVLIR